jgi:hypothetical protein
MFTLAVVDGDLSPQGGQFALVSGPSKVAQDLGLALREPFGCDPFHPLWGSVLPNMIGSPNDTSIPGLVESEIRRVVGNYQIIQQDRVQRDLVRGIPPVYGLGEVVTGTRSVQSRQNMDSIITLTTVSTEDGDVAVVTTTS